MRLQIGHLKSIQQTNGIGRKLGPRVDEERRQWKSSQQGKVPPVWTLGCCITWWGSHGMPRWGNVMTWSWHVTTFQKAGGHQLLQLLYVGRATSYRETQRVMCLFMVHFLDRRFCIDAKFTWDMGQYARYMWCCHSLINTSCACKPLQRKS